VASYSSNFTTQRAASADTKSRKIAVHTVSSTGERGQNIVTDTIKSSKTEPNLLSFIVLCIIEVSHVLIIPIQQIRDMQIWETMDSKGHCTGCSAVQTTCSFHRIFEDWYCTSIGMEDLAQLLLSSILPPKSVKPFTGKLCQLCRVLRVLARMLTNSA
jgi:hypothetical protein